MDPQSLHQAVAGWYARNARDLPWRRPPYLGNPYAILVSEVMLQQTQVDRTVPKFLEFMERFPTLEALASATVGEVVTVWEGMGYNNRAVRLHRLANVVVRELGGDLPSDPDGLRALPGIGAYTSSAIACFAFGAAVPVLDTNIYRVLSRLTQGVTAPSRKALEPLASELLPQADNAPLDASTWHQALMDIGSTICTAASPRCMLCPLRALCAAAPQLQDGADRKLAEASVPYVRRQSTFAGSTRYYRGRIVAALRKAGPEGAPIDEMGAALKDDYGGPEDEAWLTSLIDALVRDGLAVQKSGTLRLP